MMSASNCLSSVVVSPSCSLETTPPTTFFTPSALTRVWDGRTSTPEVPELAGGVEPVREGWAAVSQHRDPHTRLQQVESGIVPLVPRRRHHRSGPGPDAVEIDQPLQPGAEHHTGYVVPVEYQRRLVRTRGYHDPPGSHPDHGVALRNAQQTALVQAEGSRVREDLDAVAGLDLRGKPARGVEGRCFAHAWEADAPPGVVSQAAAEARLIVDQHDPGAHGGCEGGCHAGRSAADHRNVGVPELVVVRRPELGSWPTRPRPAT